MKARLKLIMGVLLFACLPLASPFTQRASAATFNQNNIIDDGVFDNTNTMTATHIDAFLNSFPNSCLSTNNGFSAPDPIGYNPTQGYLYGGPVSAGQVIYDATQAYGLNPQVILTTLQKEEGIVVGNGPYGCSALAISASAGYACTDSDTASHTYTYTNGTDPGTLSTPLFYSHGTPINSVTNTCVNSPLKAGFTEQVIRATWLLKFGEQRSKGNVNWAVIKGNWDNSDDPQSCYGGPMTQGTFARCPSGGATFYDGYTTIDSTAVHMDSGATAALYWYTPHFPGNQNFFNIFTGWFGSTQFPQPIGAALYYQASTSIIYLVTGTARYQVPDWDMMVNYGLDRYPVQSVPDTTIQNLTDGGLLTNLVYDSNGVYLVNNRERHPVSSSMCTAWGFSCADGTFVKPLGATFQTQYLAQGGLITPLLKASGNLYKMSSGAMQPIANSQTVTDLGLSSTPAITASTTNSRHTLGTLLMTTPGIVQFSPDPHIYYFDGTSYWTVPDMDTYYDWNLGRSAYLSVPRSAYNQTPPPSTTLNSFIVSNSKNYLVDHGTSIQIPSSLVGIWSASLFSSPPVALFNGLLADNLSSLVHTAPGVYVLDVGGKHYVQTITEYSQLQQTYGKVTSLRASKIASVTQGNDELVDGDLVLKSDNHAIYVVNNHKLTYITSPDVFNAYRYRWGDVRTYPNTITTDYPLDNLAIGNGATSDGTLYIVSGSTLYQLPPAQSNDFGAITTRFTPMTKQTIKTNPSILPRFLLNTDDGRMYYASGGAIHYVTSYASYIAYGGGRTPRVPVDTNTIQSFILAQPI